MKTKKKAMAPILVAVDFSQDAEAALVFAAKLADCHATKLIVLHVVHDPAEAPGYYTKKRKKLLKSMEEIAEEEMQGFLHRVRKTHAHLTQLKHADALLVVGLPVTKILQVASKVDASMVVMGSRGRTRLAHLMMGSKAEQVVRLCERPVTIVKLPREANHGEL